MKPLTILKSYLNARTMGREHEDRLQFEHWQKHYLNRFFKLTLKTFPAYQSYGGKDLSLLDFPLSDKEHLNENMSGYTHTGLTCQELKNAILHEDDLTDSSGNRLFGGQSSGTSGTPGYYLFDAQEQSAWIGTALGKLVPDFWKRRMSVTIVLPRNTPLYTGVGRLPWFKVNFVSAQRDIMGIMEEVEQSNPDVLICSPRIAPTLVEGCTLPRLTRLILGSEVVDPGHMERLRMYVPSVEQIYMATEGLFATTCKHGKLHLSEDLMHFEFEEMSDGLVNPIITDFTRHSMLMLRYRMNDALRLSNQPCTCGSPFKVVDEIIGRKHDAFVCERAFGPGVTIVQPDRIRTWFLDLAPCLDDWSIEQVSLRDAVLYLPDWHDHLDLKSLSVETLCETMRSHFFGADAKMNFSVKPISQHEYLERRNGPKKLRRIQRSWEHIS
jgi:putative adenylate-forming enzyme